MAKRRTVSPSAGVLRIPAIALWVCLCIQIAGFWKKHAPMMQVFFLRDYAKDTVLMALRQIGRAHV